MQFYFIRHGQSFNNALWDATGASVGRSEDPELTEIGWQQARHVAYYLAGGNPHPNGNAPHNPFGLTHLYTSLMVRSVNTALCIAEVLGLPPMVWEDLHETGGIFQEDETGERIGLPGKERAWFATHHPTLVLPDALNEQGWWHRPYESIEQHPVRARRFLHDLLDRHGGTNHRVAVVSHGNFYRYFLAALLRMPDVQSYYFALNNAAISRVDFSEHDVNEVVIAYLNRVDFLPAELIT